VSVCNKLIPHRTKYSAVELDSSAYRWESVEQSFESVNTIRDRTYGDDGRPERLSSGRSPTEIGLHHETELLYPLLKAEQEVANGTADCAPGIDPPERPPPSHPGA
jgi:hypothetical protein